MCKVRVIVKVKVMVLGKDGSRIPDSIDQKQIGAMDARTGLK